MTKIQLALSFLGLASTVAAAASAGPPNANNQTPVIRIVNHLTNQGVSATRMFLDVSLDRTLLYVVGSDQKTTTVIDVTVPAKARVVATPARAPDGAMVLTSSTPGPGIQVLDLSDPRNPHAMAELAGPTSVVVDSQHGLVYLSNAQGLWIVHNSALVDPSVAAWEQFAAAP